MFIHGRIVSVGYVHRVHPLVDTINKDKYRPLERRRVVLVYMIFLCYKMSTDEKTR